MHVVKTGEKEMEFDILPLKMGDRGSNFGSAGNVKSEVITTVLSSRSGSNCLGLLEESKTKNNGERRDNRGFKKC